MILILRLLRKGAKQLILQKPNNATCILSVISTMLNIKIKEVAMHLFLQDITFRSGLNFERIKKCRKKYGIKKSK